MNRSLLSILKLKYCIVLSICCFAATFSTHAQTRIKGLVLLIDYSDAPSTLTVSRTDSLFNYVGYTAPNVTSSVRDYWYRQSRGKVIMTHDVAGVYRAPHTAAWYQGQPYEELLHLMDSALMWFRDSNPTYPWDSLTVSTTPGEEGTFLSLNFFTSALVPGALGTHVMNDFTAPNGKKSKQVVATMSGYPGWDINVNLFWTIHEMCHSIFTLPDLYNYTDASNGTGYYTVLSGNTYTGDVEPIGAPFLAQLGWVTVVDVCDDQDYTLRADGDTIARFLNNKDPKEFYLVEARKKATVGNAIFPVAKGLVVWHVDSNKIATGNSQPQMTYAQHDFISVIQADGQFDLENHVNKMDSGDIFLPGNILNDTTTPDSKWWNDSVSYFNISNITFPTADHIRFHNQHCSPAYTCEAGALYSGYEYIANVQFADIDNTSGAATYSDFTAISTDVEQGSNVNVSDSIGEVYPADQVLIWCDWNADGDFNDSLELAFSPAIGANPATGTIAVPSNASTGDIKMRVRMLDTANPPATTTPCGNSAWGEVEDYTLHIVSSLRSVLETSDAGALIAEKAVLNIRPNPTNGDFTVTINNADGSAWNCKVLNFAGQVIYQGTLPAGGKFISKQINLSSAPKGTYIVKLSNRKGKEFTKKIVIK